MSRVFVSGLASVVTRRSDDLRVNRAMRERWLLATLGTVPVALALGVALALTLPSRSSLGLALGSYSLLPIWLAAASFTFLANNARQAWVSLIRLAALAALLSCSVLVLEHALGR
jgi:hypothetical protein